MMKDISKEKVFEAINYLNKWNLLTEKECYKIKER